MVDGRTPDPAAAEPGARRQSRRTCRELVSCGSTIAGRLSSDRLIDLSQEAARATRFRRLWALLPVRVQFVSLADAQGVPPQPTIRHVRAPTPEPAGAPTTQLVATAAAQCPGPFIQAGAFAERARAHRVMAELHALQPMPVTLGNAR